MKSKQDLKSFFENGDKPNQEQFWALIESYFHKDEPITLEELSMLKTNLATVDKTNNGTETIGNVDTKEQVNAKINFAINALKANAPETYDTLKEIADYIANDSNAEAALLQLINTKLDKPTMTNNYYGLWDDTNKKFVNGELQADGNKVGIGISPETNLVVFGDNEEGNKGVFQIQTPDSNLKIGGNLGYSWIQSHLSNPLYINHLDNNVIINKTAGKVGIGTDLPSEKLEISGNTKADSYKFKLPTTITPQPNMLIPKTDGSGLMWYDNNSVGKEIAVGNSTFNEIDTIATVANRGNIVPLQGLTYIKEDTDVIETRINSDTWSQWFGNMNPNHTGYLNQSFGYGALSKVTSGAYNISFGSYAGNSITTAESNSLIGSSSGFSLTTGNYNTIVGGESGYNSLGFKNTFLGYGAGYWDNTGNLGTFIGYKSGNGNRFGNNNLMLGNYAGGRQASSLGVGTMGNSNVFIGTGAGYNNTELSNKLIIHSNSSLTGFLNTTEGNFTTNDGKLEYALITGDFVERWVKFNGKFIVGASYMPLSDSSFTKNIVAKADGTFGWEDKKTLEINISKGVSFPTTPSSGDLFFNTSDNKHYGFNGASWNVLY